MNFSSDDEGNVSEAHSLADSSEDDEIYKLFKLPKTKERLPVKRLETPPSEEEKNNIRAEMEQSWKEHLLKMEQEAEQKAAIQKQHQDAAFKALKKNSTWVNFAQKPQKR